MKKVIISKFIIIIFCFTSLNLFAKDESSDVKIHIGSKKFTESVILGEMITQLVKNSGYLVQHHRELGGTRILWNALIAGEIDTYAEYTGTLTQEIFHDQNLRSLSELKSHMRDLNIEMTAVLGFNNTYALGVKEELAQQLDLTSISDLRQHPNLELGFGSEFLHRDDGWPGIKQHYQLPHTRVRGMDHDLAYRGIDSGATQIIDLFSTDAEIAYYKLRALVDDKNFFPAYEAIIIYRKDLQHRAPQAISNLEKLAGAIDEASMIQMNAQVKLEHQAGEVVAADYIRRTLGINSEHVVQSKMQQFLQYTYEHLLLVGISLFAAIIIAIPLGILAAYHPLFGHIILAVTSIIQTIPSLALFVFMIPLLGIGGPPALVALFLYSLLPIVRNTYAGLTSIPLSIRESAAVIGLSRAAQLRFVELPLSTRSILAGVKTSAVINVGTATLAALIGAGGYGQPILTGIRLDDMDLILMGAVPAALLALFVQGMFELSERWFVPKGLRIETNANN